MKIFEYIKTAIDGELPKTEYNGSDAAAEEAAESIFKISKKHDIAQLVAQGMKLKGELPDGEIGRAFENESLKAVYRYALITNELARIKNIFEEAGVKFVPLKGAVLRGLYPEGYLRNSCDIDILVRPEDEGAAAAKLTEKLGYVVKYRTTHDLQIYTLDERVHIELHYELIEDDFFDAADKVLAAVWDDVSPVSSGSCEHEMSREMFYFYHISHMAKHIKYGGGCGIKQFVDIYVMKKNGYLPNDISLLEKGGLLRFAKIAEALTDKWFCGIEPEAELSEGTKMLEKYVLDSGVYGSINNLVTLRRKNKGQFRYILSRMFLSYGDMKLRYPSIKGKRYLMPFYQVRRWFSILFGDSKKRGLQELKLNGNISKEQIELANNIMDELGL